MDVGGSKIFVGRFSHDGILENSVKRKTEGEKGSHHVQANLVSAISEVFSQNVQAIGIAWAGFVDAKTGIILTSPNIPQFEHVHLADLIAKQFSCPVVLENDARLFALAEAKMGKAKHVRDMLGIILGTGVGSGIMLGGNMYRGHNGFAGEIGHTTFGSCENVTADSLFSARGWKLSLLKSPDETLESVIADWKEHHRPSGHRLDIFLSQLSRWIANIVLTFNPGMIVFGGGIGANVVPLVITDLAQRVQNYFLTKNFSLDVNLAVSELENAGALGAMLLAQKKFRRDL